IPPCTTPCIWRWRWRTRMVKITKPTSTLSTAKPIPRTAWLSLMRRRTSSVAFRTSSGIFFPRADAAVMAGLSLHCAKYSGRGQTTVERDGYAGEPRRFVRGQVDGQFGDVRGFAEAAERNRGGTRFAERSAL